MAKVKFVRSVKYDEVRYPAHTPFEVRDEELEALKEAGALVIEGPAVTPTKVAAPTKPALDVQALTKMTTAELKRFALENNINISASDAKADVFNAIMTAFK